MIRTLALICVDRHAIITGEVINNLKQASSIFILHQYSLNTTSMERTTRDSVGEAYCHGKKNQDKNLTRSGGVGPSLAQVAVETLC